MYICPVRSFVQPRPDHCGDTQVDLQGVPDHLPTIDKSETTRYRQKKGFYGGLSILCCVLKRN